MTPLESQTIELPNNVIAKLIASANGIAFCYVEWRDSYDGYGYFAVYNGANVAFRSASDWGHAEHQDGYNAAKKKYLELSA